MDLASLKYATSHEWVHVADGYATVGITRFAVDQLTDVTYLELPKVGKVLKAGDEFGVIESVKSTSPLYSPVAGEVVEVNAGAAKDTSAINADPYDVGWLIKLKLATGATTDHLMSLPTYEKQIAAS
jgi:glycine cleavage system H protein